MVILSVVTLAGVAVVTEMYVDTVLIVVNVKVVGMDDDTLVAVAVVVVVLVIGCPTEVVTDELGKFGKTIPLMVMYQTSLRSGELLYSPPNKINRLLFLTKLVNEHCRPGGRDELLVVPITP